MQVALRVELLPVAMVLGLALRVQTGAVTLSANVAVTLLAALMLMVQLAAPVQSPLQPVKLLPVAGVAVRVTLVPLVKLAVHVAPQLMPEPATAPVPAPALLTVSVKLLGVDGVDTSEVRLPAASYP
jgi:hypothetical protein